MSLSQTLSRPAAYVRLLSRPVQIIIAILIGLAAAALFAQMEGERGVPPIASGGDFEVRGVKVDVQAKDADTARYAGWRMAQRQAWRMLWSRTHGGAGAPALSDSQIEAMVSGVEVEYEQNGPNRYVATLGILFDRARTGALLGVSGNVMRSPPLLVIPVLWDGGSAVSYERTNEWQKAWARYRTGDSAIDYVRVAGSIADPILLNAGQTGRRGRLWWRVLLDQYGAADVVVPIARLDRAYPGGPVTGTFTARYGPDDSLIGSVTLRASNDSGIPQMMDEGARRIDELYIRALNDGRLRPDPSLVIEEPVDPAALEIENAIEAPVEALDLPTVSTAGASFIIQFDTPDVASVGSGESTVRSIPGVRLANTSSLALGGTSVMQVSFDGTADMLRAGLQARGFSVAASGNTLRITRRQASPPPQ
ncbi:heavy-metal-associated domain-containing protein [Sphingobium limneticum]|uniref:Heavy-metal-associated domain-containing protein n=1 Tax=Sphingobium limneticum TaxID=1007511 RepID=A0A5J5I3G5_9SPHN|nr:heavy-metal-associated domain-containing protein [Sphingobium limneticum]KAA9017630.1 heavy-metal-associated domain-containing protein [Sphingobium limneticum]KAA9030221.1 heavy-metal-associated domain-containing protein [Sphingobium limneticum]